MSSSPDLEAFHAPQGLHHLLAVGLPAAATALVCYDVLDSWPWAVLLVLLLQSLALSAWGQWRSTTRRPPLVKFWLWALVLALTAGVLVLLVGPWWWEWTLVAFAQGQLSALWQSQLVARARLFYKLEGVPEGPALETRVHDFQLDADFSPANRRTLLASLAVLTAVVVAAAVATTRGQRGWGLVLAVAYVVVALVVTGLLGLYRREMVALMYGRRLTLGEKLLPLVSVAALAVVSGLIAWLVVGVLPVLVDWRQVLVGGPSPPPPLTLPDRLPPLVQPGLTSPEGLPALWVAWWLQVLHVQRLFQLFDLVVWALLWGLPVAVLAWMLLPLLRLLGPDRPRLRGVLRLWWRLLLLQLQEFWSRLKALGRDPLSWGQAQQALTVAGPQAWLKSLSTLLNRRSRRRWTALVAAFVELMEWARPEVDYRPGETTGAYCRRVAEAFPGHADDLARIAAALETELFARQGLSSAERQQFLATVRSVVVNSKHDPDT